MFLQLLDKVFFHKIEIKTYKHNDNVVLGKKNITITWRYPTNRPIIHTSIVTLCVRLTITLLVYLDN